MRPYFAVGAFVNRWIKNFGSHHPNRYAQIQNLRFSRNSAALNPIPKTMALVGARIRNIGYHCAMSKRPIPLLSVNTRAQPNWQENLGFASAPQITAGIRVTRLCKGWNPRFSKRDYDSATAIMVKHNFGVDIHISPPNFWHVKQRQRGGLCAAKGTPDPIWRVEGSERQLWGRHRPLTLVLTSDPFR
jgi:hypothetical protein